MSTWSETPGGVLLGVGQYMAIEDSQIGVSIYLPIRPPNLFRSPGVENELSIAPWQGPVSTRKKLTGVTPVKNRWLKDACSADMPVIFFDVARKTANNEKKE